MKVLSITKELPASNYSRNGSKHKKIYDKVKTLKKNEWLPIEFETQRKAASFRACAARNEFIVAKTRKNIVYLGNKGIN